MEKIAGFKLFAPLLSQSKTFHAPLLKGWKLVIPSYSMAKTSRVLQYSYFKKLCVAPFIMVKKIPSLLFLGANVLYF